ncbi:MAG: 50S ribosomal protein L11 methyltransferase [Desulfocapsaceae bacterium]
MKILKFDIELDSLLVDAFSDHLIGVHNAAIESAVGDDEDPVVLQAFVKKDLVSIEAAESVAGQIREYGGELAQIFACATPVVAVEILEDRDWSETWKVHFKPFAIVQGLVIAPTWEHYETGSDEQVIVMDPGMAFGTGHHETTRLCLELLRESEPLSSGGTMLDVGTGTGILAMAALLFGARRVVGIDNDPEAVKTARANCRLNTLSNRMEITGRELKEIKNTFDLVTANIVHDVLLELSDDLARVTGDGGSLLLSGLIEGEQGENIAQCFSDKSFRLIEKRTDGQWCALLLIKVDTAEQQK